MTEIEQVFTRIDTLRNDRKITKKDFCERLGVKQQAYTHWQTGKNTSFMGKLVDIATVLAVPIDVIVHGDIGSTAKLTSDLRELAEIMEKLDRHAIHQLMTYAYQLQKESEEREKTQTGYTSETEVG